MRFEKIMRLVGLILGLVIASPTQATEINIRIGDVKVETGDHEHHGRKGPPPHAPAHGYRAKHHYHYYPAAECYRDADSGLWFYLSGDGWKMGASLPVDLRVRLGSSVSLELDTDRPYVHHHEHKRKYPRRHMKEAKHKAKDKD